LWAIVIVPSAHGGNSSKWLPFLMISEVEQRIRLYANSQRSRSLELSRDARDLN
jgi:hypothetical protein